MEPFHEAVNSGIEELKNLQEALEARSPDESPNLSAVKSHLARINVWAVSTRLAIPKSELTSHWYDISESIHTQIRSLLDDLVDLCREGTTTRQMQPGAETSKDST